ncbi:ThiF family adenylyltransferase (plasmid) [Acidiphilium multivorum]|uniref:ThiF family adenylyltransferase n=1 Tax=Acidiphilium multivorum TaxID=62140 RepID=UPI001CDB5738|nr:ThiF family adenylyltransferase [Acidiphilium multivorum]UBU64055.1 ThiF family adenylyltransferase [Acidithiobacillus ferrooxidans]UNC16637.1 ThiF family adenylyltransferase [Acidiphilium multivorum]
MSQKLVDRNPDLRRLRDEGYSVEVRDGYLVVSDIPYVDSQRTVRRGVLVSELTMLADRTQRPSTHVIRFAGEFPCSNVGAPIEAIRNQSQREQLLPDLFVDHAFSSKPRIGYYANYYEKIRTYADILVGYAQAIDPTASPLFVRPLVNSDAEGPFHYIDTASSRAGIALLTKKLNTSRVAIVGLGGTGSYVLDLIAKTPIEEIHLFDGDKFFQHNAFRAPGAASMEELGRSAYKVDYFRSIYSHMHRGIVAHPNFVGRADLDFLQSMDFAFICMDSGSAKQMLMEALKAAERSFIDVGMGIELADDVLTGMARVTTSTPGHRDHVADCVSFADNAADNLYARNIQIAEMNALNAALAVIQWKKLCGFYFDPSPGFNTTYVISTNKLIKDEVREDNVAM